MNKVNKAISFIKDKGINFTLKKILNKFYVKKIQNYKSYKELFADKSGIEIGGPSWLFKKTGRLPLYSVINKLDGCNFSKHTIWEGDLKEGNNYQYEKDKIGYQYICDAVDLNNKISPESYDFVISCNCLEHIANPLKAINEWLKVIKKNGLILVVVPKKDSIFDHNRSVTPFHHLKEDFENETDEDDLSHLDEILKLHDLSLDPPAGNFEQFRLRSLQNYRNRALHHHVFDMNLLIEVLNFFNLLILLKNDIGTDYVICGRKISS